MMGSLADLDSLIQNPSWLDMFEPDMPDRKAAFCFLYRDLMFADEVAFLARVVALGGTLNISDDLWLEVIFARILGLATGLDWKTHPNCLRLT